MSRFLRPGRPVYSGGAAWLVDESWPVALVGGDDGSASLLSWPWRLERISRERDQVTVADGVGIVVGDGAQVAWVSREGTNCVLVDGDWILAAADPQIAWFVDRSAPDPGQPPTPPPPGRILAVHRDGSSTQTDASSPVIAIDVDGADMWVTLADPPLAERRGPNWRSYLYPRSVLRVPKASLLTTGLAEAVPATGDHPATARPRHHGWVWLHEEPDAVIRSGERAGGLVWWAGAPYDSDRIERQVVVVGSDLSTGQPLVRVDLGRGVVRDLQAIGDELWVVVARRRYLAVPNDRGVDVLAIAASGAVRTVHSADSINISAFEPPLTRPPQAQITEHINEVRHEFADFGGSWRREDGPNSPITPGLSEPSVAVEGDWPDAHLVVTMRHRSRPGLMLRRTLPLFDDTGAPINHQSAGSLLLEDLDTNYVAPTEEAVEGVLNT